MERRSILSLDRVYHGRETKRRGLACVEQGAKCGRVEATCSSYGFLVSCFLRSEVRSNLKPLFSEQDPHRSLTGFHMNSPKTSKVLIFDLPKQNNNDNDDNDDNDRTDMVTKLYMTETYCKISISSIPKPIF